MTTAVVSDLHLGANGSLLEREEVRARLFDALRGMDRLVLLGDTLALRAAPAREVVERAAPFFDELRTCLAGRELVIVPGNHDHQLAEPLLDELRLEGRLGLDTVRPAHDVGVLGAIVRRLDGVRTTVAYPGIRLRPDVYATHGHYLDCHQTVPRLETVLASVSTALAGRLPSSRLTPDDYESRLAPIYGFAYRWAQGRNGARRSTGPTRLWSRVQSHGWRQLEAGTAVEETGSARSGAPRRPLLRATVAAMNLAGLGPFDARLGAAELGEAGFRAMGEVSRRLDIDAVAILFGHTHRAGPLPDEQERRTTTGTLLVNTGSWAYSPTLVGRAGASSPYWPGTCTFVAESGPPRLERLLDEEIVNRSP